MESCPHEEMIIPDEIKEQIELNYDIALKGLIQTQDYVDKYNFNDEVLSYMNKRVKKKLHQAQISKLFKFAQSHIM